MIIYFSGNGNTKWCARTMARFTGDKAVPMVELSHDISLGKDESLGLFFPIHGWMPPRIVLDFVATMRLTTRPTYCYSVCTCGDSAGEAVDVLRRALSAKGIHLSAAFSIVMPETYVCLPFMYTDTFDNERRKVESAVQKMGEIAPLVWERKDNIEDVKKGPLPWFFTHVVGAFFNRCMITDRPFRVSHALCTHCGKCAQVCPVGNIAYDEDGFPKWSRGKGRCTCCMACYHHCPHHAIDYGKITRNRGQYYFGMHSYYYTNTKK